MGNIFNVKRDQTEIFEDEKIEMDYFEYELESVKTVGYQITSSSLTPLIQALVPDYIRIRS